MSTIKFDKINKIYENGFHAVHDFELEIKDGEFIIKQIFLGLEVVGGMEAKIPVSTKFLNMEVLLKLLSKLE